MAALNRDAILGADDLVREPLEVPEWGGTVYVRAMTAGENDAVIKGHSKTTFGPNGVPQQHVDIDGFKTAIVVRSLVDEDGNRMFGDHEVGLLAGKSNAAIDKVFEVAQRLNGGGEAAIAEAVGNSDASRNGDGNSDLRSLSAAPTES